MNELQVVGDGAPDLSPRNFDELLQFADTLARSNLVPKEYVGKPENIVVSVQWGYEIGLKPMQALQNIAVVGNRPSLWGDAMLALVLSSPVCKDVIEYYEGEGDTLTAVCIAKRHGRADKKATFSLADAIKAELVSKDVWKKYSPRMLQMRARGYALRDQFADVLRGMPIAELEIERVKNMGPVEEVQPEDAPTVGTRTESVKQRMRKQRMRKQRDSTPTLDDVLRRIAEAQNAEELTAAGALAAHLHADEQKAIARTAYSDKLEASRKPKRNEADPGKQGATSRAPEVTFAYVMDALEHGDTLDALDTAADLIRAVADERQREELEEFYVAKRGKLEAA
ncbi:hypothetical protein [Paraburkholderia phytofirmans]|uniref:hypothetical protein n=1 Tax=Paraburkholderia phytofirmans TaxID=261302 RepID=UPI0038B99092